MENALKPEDPTIPMKPKAEDPTIPMKPEAVDGAVELVDPPEQRMTLTADAAEISGLRLMDAADKARGKL